jgi:hypothetical protein
MITIATTFDDAQFTKDMKNITEYMYGFVDGTKAGKPQLMNLLGVSVKTILEEFIDSSARVDPESLSHVYEWYQNGSSDARLFDILYTPSGRGLSFGFTLRQSSSIKDGSKTPFYDKARIMEYGVPVTITPTKAQALSFDIDGKTVFTKKSVTVENPGGAAAEGGLKNAFTQFFTQYISQALLDVTGLRKHFEIASEFNDGFRSAKSGGRSLGTKMGIKWISGGIK